MSVPNKDLGTITWEGPLPGNVRNLGGRLNSAIGLYMHYQAPKVQDYMRGNAKWTDRTGNARGGLFAKYDNLSEGTFGITLYHTMPYGIWLEVKHSGQYAIIFPTVSHEGQRIFEGIRGLLAKIVAI
jgi:hypothetical protein